MAKNTQSQKVTKKADAETTQIQTESNTMKTVDKKLTKKESKSKDTKTVEATVETAQPKVLKEKRRNDLPDTLSKELKFTQSMKELSDKLDKQVNVMKAMRADVMKLKSSYQHDIVKAYKTKRTNGEKKPKEVGFNKARLIADKFADLVGLPHSTVITVPKYSCELNKLLVKRGLRFDGDKRVFRVDEELSKMFDIPMSVNASVSVKDTGKKDKDTGKTAPVGFNIYTIQKFISPHLMEDLKQKQEDVEQKLVEEKKEVVQEATVNVVSSKQKKPTKKVEVSVLN
jgi:hypothetical protein